MCSRREGSYETGLWKAIRRGLEEFQTTIKLVVHDGRRVRFWHDL